jgi:hypothetical protein
LLTGQSRGSRLLGTGIAKIAKVLTELRRQNFSSLVAVEHEKEGHVNQELEQEIAFAKNLRSRWAYNREG